MAEQLTDRAGSRAGARREGGHRVGHAARVRRRVRRREDPRPRPHEGKGEAARRAEVVRARRQAEHRGGRRDRSRRPAAARRHLDVVNVHRFEAMGCEIVVAGAEPAAVAAVFEEWEDAFSLFRPESELSRVNRSDARVVAVSPLFARALDGRARRRGGDGRPRRPDALRALARGRGSRDASLSRPPALALDLNGVVKSLAVDAAAELIEGEGFVSAGGDIAVRGPVDVALPHGGAIRVIEGGLATSGTASRGRHLVDPRTGEPSDSPWEQVTASGSSCLAADVAAKVAFLLGDGRAGVARRAPHRRPLRRARRRDRRELALERSPRVHLSSNPAFWYATRASGIAAYVILSVVVCIGMSMGGKAQSARWPRFSVEDIHRFGGLLVGALIAIHVVTIAVDSFLPFSIAQPRRAVHVELPAALDRASGSPPPSSSSRSRSRTTTASGSRTRSGGRRTTPTSRSGRSPPSTA